MSNFQSVQNYEAPADAAIYRAPLVNADAGTTIRVVEVNGETTISEDRRGSRASAAELNPHYNDGTVFATAKSRNGTFVRSITEETLITINGVQASCKNFEEAGLIHRDASGAFVEGPSAEAAEASKETPEETGGVDELHMPDDVITEVHRAFDTLQDHHVDPILAMGVAATMGQMDFTQVAAKLVNFSGTRPAEAEGQVEYVRAAYQEQANAAVSARCGIAPEDIGDFWAYCKENHSGSLRDAVNEQLHRGSMGGYRALAGRYMAANPPTLAAVKAGGYETRSLGATPEVLIDGKWMTVQIAARLGYF